MIQSPFPCSDQEVHGKHTYRPVGTPPGTQIECPGIKKFSCGGALPHRAHTYSGPNGDATQYRCPGVAGEPVERKMPERRCDKLTMHAAHKWSDDRGLNYAWCKGLDALTASLISKPETFSAPERDSPPKWEYHVDTIADRDRPGGWKHQIVKRREDQEAGQIITAYKNGVYARIVADALNGGVLLGFEVEK